ncbi:NfeD family protein [Allocoleopsis sp.]|uniref:NfeD family protein n=1 Tax=Allocoleopsis sp. TaxID=3088169 RepID=UPI002FD5E48E
MEFTIIGLLAQTTTNSPFVFSPPWFWLTAGVILCTSELFIHKIQANKYRLIALIMGVNALIVSLILWQFTTIMDLDWQYIMYEDFQLHIMFWMGLSLTSVIWVRPMFIKRKTYRIQETTEAMTLSEILPGQTGRVLYEGCSWQGRCENYQSEIASNQKVYVLRREGNTLIVASEKLFHS